VHPQTPGPRGTCSRTTGSTPRCSALRPALGRGAALRVRERNRRRPARPRVDRAEAARLGNITLWPVRILGSCGCSTATTTRRGAPTITPRSSLSSSRWGPTAPTVLEVTMHRSLLVVMLCLGSAPRCPGQAERGRHGPTSPPLPARWRRSDRGLLAHPPHAGPALRRRPAASVLKLNRADLLLLSGSGSGRLAPHAADGRAHARSRPGPTAYLDLSTVVR